MNDEELVEVPKIDFKARASKAHNTLKLRLGRKKYKLHMAEIGAKGGKANVPKGFSKTRKKAPDAQELHTRELK